MNRPRCEPLLLKFDCIRLYVPDLDAGLAFYGDRLGHELIWRTEDAAGLRLPDSDAEIVLHTEPGELEVDLKVRAADAAAARFGEAGGEVLVPPFEVQIGRAVLVRDPWGNRYVLLDASKGLLVTDADGNVVGNAPVDEALARTDEGSALEADNAYSDLYEDALRLAARAHRAQPRKGTDLPYVTHPVHVSMLLLRHGFPLDVAVAGLLHDVVEDQGYPLSAIEDRFGARVAEIVGALSERESDAQGEGRSWQVRKREAVEQLCRASAEAAAVKAADTLHNARSIALDLRREGSGIWRRFTGGPEQILGYSRQIVQVARGKLGDHPLVAELAQAVEDLARVAFE